MPDPAIVQLKEQAIIAAARAVVRKAQSCVLPDLLQAIEVLRHRLHDLDVLEAGDALSRPQGK